MLYSYLNSYLGVYPGKAYILILLQWALQWKPGIFNQTICTNSVTAECFFTKLVLTLWLLLWTCAFVHNLCELGWYLGELQFKSILWYNLPVDSLSNVQNCTTALIIWLRGLTSPNAVCWCQTDYKEQKRFGGLVKELGEERCKTPQKISNHLNLQLS